MLREELDKIRKDGITQEELDQAKVAYLQAARVRRSNDSSIDVRIAFHHVQRSNDGALRGTRFAQIGAATVDSVNQRGQEVHRS